jgi:hypothetical protein
MSHQSTRKEFCVFTSLLPDHWFLVGFNIIPPTPRNMKETTYDRKKKKINKELNQVKESGIKYWRHQSSWQKPKYFDRDGVHLNDDGHFNCFCSIRMCVKLNL